MNLVVFFDNKEIVPSQYAFLNKKCSCGGILIVFEFNGKYYKGCSSALIKNKLCQRNPTRTVRFSNYGRVLQEAKISRELQGNKTEAEMIRFPVTRIK